ncbi:hypothetical protein [Sphingomonas sp. BK580]|uniref:hypothetical protein n=1 Tax=Sphingomonas sp. BK580 TaxID=2586972 RepID=UPI001607AA1C|nr:hypothetical protein [Sphingomonas sp. BK580]MBB3695206.1 hypothetical protein [Sphingomonas sp. BK580]
MQWRIRSRGSRKEWPHQPLRSDDPHNTKANDVKNAVAVLMALIVLAFVVFAWFSTASEG